MGALPQKPEMLKKHLFFNGFLKGHAIRDFFILKKRSTTQKQKKTNDVHTYTYTHIHTYTHTQPHSHTRMHTYTQTRRLN